MTITLSRCYFPRSASLPLIFRTIYVIPSVPTEINVCPVRRLHFWLMFIQALVRGLYTVIVDLFVVRVSAGPFRSRPLISPEDIEI